MPFDWRTAQVLHDLCAVASACSPSDPIADLNDFVLPNGDEGYEVRERLELAAGNPEAPEMATFAIAVLLADALRHGFGFAMPDQDFHVHSDFVRSLPAPRRAVLMRAWHRLRELRLARDIDGLGQEEMRGLDRDSVVNPLIWFAKGMSDFEIVSISMADYGSRSAEHEAALRAVLADPECRLPRSNRRCPAEVIELTAHVPEEGGAQRSTALCVLDDIYTRSEKDQMTFRWQKHGPTYLTWPEHIRDPILRVIRYIYETEIDGSWGFQMDQTTAMIPWFDD